MDITGVIILFVYLFAESCFVYGLMINTMYLSKQWIAKVLAKTVQVLHSLQYMSQTVFWYFIMWHDTPDNFLFKTKNEKRHVRSQETSVRHQMKCHIRCVPNQGLHSSKLPAFTVYIGRVLFLVPSSSEAETTGLKRLIQDR